MLTATWPVVLGLLEEHWPPSAAAAPGHLRLWGCYTRAGERLHGPTCQDTVCPALAWWPQSV